MSNTPKLGIPEIAEGQDNAYVMHNEGVRVSDALVQPTVIAMDIADAPSVPTDGDTYVVAAGSTSGDDWDGHTDEIAYFQSTDWVFFAPVEGWKVYNQADGTTYIYSNASDGWVAENAAAATSYDIGFTKSGLMTSSQVLLRIPAVRDFALYDNFSGSKLKSGAAAAAETVLVVQRSGVQIGTITVALGGTTGTFTTSGTGAEEFHAADDDVLTILAPGTPDTTLAGVGVLFKGYKI